MISLKHKVKKADAIIDNDVSSLHLSARIVQCLQVLMDLPVDVQTSLEFIRSGVISGAANPVSIGLCYLEVAVGLAAARLQLQVGLLFFLNGTACPAGTWRHLH